MDTSYPISSSCPHVHLYLTPAPPRASIAVGFTARARSLWGWGRWTRRTRSPPRARTRARVPDAVSVGAAVRWSKAAVRAQAVVKLRVRPSRPSPPHPFPMLGHPLPSPTARRPPSHPSADPVGPSPAARALAALTWRGEPGQPPPNSPLLLRDACAGSSKGGAGQARLAGASEGCKRAASAHPVAPASSEGAAGTCRCRATARRRETPPAQGWARPTGAGAGAPAVPGCKAVHCIRRCRGACTAAGCARRRAEGGRPRASDAAARWIRRGSVGAAAEVGGCLGEGYHEVYMAVGG